MNLFDLVAKLTLDTKEYEQAITEAEREGTRIDDIEAELDLNTAPFEAAVEEAEGTDVADPESPELGLDDTEFKSVVENAEGTDVDDPEAPELDLDDSEFQSVVEDAEATEVADPASPELDLDTTPFSDALAEVEDQDLPTFEQSVGQTLEGIKGLIAGAGIAVAISSVVSSLSEAVDLARSMGDNIDKSSRAMSISTDAYQEWSHVLDINGANITDLNRGLMNMRKLMGGGEPTKEFTQAMVQLGLATEDAEGNITSQFSSTEDMLKSAMKALADFDTSTEAKLAQRDYLAQAIFGRGGTKLNAMFDGTSEDIDALIQQAHELGLVMSEEAVANAAAYNDAVTNMNASIESFRVAIVENVLPALTDVFNKVAAIVAFFNPRTHENGLSEQFKDIDEQLGMDIVDIEATSKAAGTMIDKLFSMGDATKLTAQEQAEWKATADWLVKNIPSLSDVIDKDTLSVTANKDEVIALTQEWRNYAIERAKADALKSKQEALAKKTTQWLDAEAQAVKLEGEAEKARNKVLEIARRDFEKMPENRQLDLAKTLGHEDVESLLASENGLRGIANLLSSAYSERGFSNFGSMELENAIAESQTAMDSYAIKLDEARKKADALKKEVDDGQKELADYSATLDKIVGDLVKTGDEANDTGKDVEALKKDLDGLPDSKLIRIALIGDMPHFLLKAKGDWDVPYDNMPALLHRGERVLTASQARQEDSSSGSSKAVVGAILSLKNDLRQLQLVVNGKTFGRAVVDYGGNRMDNYLGDADSKLYSGYGT